MTVLLELENVGLGRDGRSWCVYTLDEKNVRRKMVWPGTFARALESFADRLVVEGFTNLAEHLNLMRRARELILDNIRSGAMVASRQHNLFGNDEAIIDDIKKLHHRSGPDTSRDAAEAHTKSGNRASHMVMVLQVVKDHPGYTASELHAGWLKAQGLEEYEVRRRLSDLKNTHGEVYNPRDPKEADKLQKRTCGIRGTKMVIWRAVTGRGRHHIKQEEKKP